MQVVESVDVAVFDDVFCSVHLIFMSFWIVTLVFKTGSSGFSPLWLGLWE